MGKKRKTLLGILANGETYGLIINNLYKDQTGKHIWLGAMYALLDRMEDRGWLTSRMGETGPHRKGRRRKYYKITEAGIAAWEAVKNG